MQDEIIEGDLHRWKEELKQLNTPFDISTDAESLNLISHV